MPKNLTIKNIKQTHNELPDLSPWFDNESDLYEELPAQEEFPYERIDRPFFH